MEKKGSKKWVFQFQGIEEAASRCTALTVRDAMFRVMGNLDEKDERGTVNLGHGDPSAFACFQTTPIAEDAILNALRSAQFNGYAPAVGLLPPRRSIADYLSRDLPYKLSADDIFLTVGANHAIEVILTVLAIPAANILFPRPGYPLYEARAAFSNLEVRHYDLLPEKGWEVDLSGMEALADDKTIAIVIINPGNPCGNVYTYEHLQKVADSARKLGIFVIADEIYNSIVFGSKPFVPMGIFGSIVPVITLGTISKRWSVPGWRLGWIAITDPNSILQKSWISESLKRYLNIAADPATFIQGAVPEILEKTPQSYFSRNINLLREDADICYAVLKEISSITCPYKPEGSMSIMVKLNLSILEGINDDMDFCLKLAKEESVIVLPGFVLGLKNWIRVTFAVEPSYLKDGLERMKAFCLRHSKK